MPHRMMLAPPENVMVQCENLVKIYKTTDVEVMALQGLDLTVERGELMGIVGASGSGKSTLLNMLGALDKPSAGSLYVDGKDLLKFDEKDLINIREKRSVLCGRTTPETLYRILRRYRTLKCRFYFRDTRTEGRERRSCSTW